MIPYAEFGGQTYSARVLARTRDDATGLVDATFERLGDDADTYQPRPVGIIGSAPTGATGGRHGNDMLREVISSRKRIIELERRTRDDARS